MYDQRNIMLYTHQEMSRIGNIEKLNQQTLVFEWKDIFHKKAVHSIYIKMA